MSSGCPDLADALRYRSGMAVSCSRVDCNEPAVAMFGFDAAAALVWIDPYEGRARGAGLLCVQHADTITPLRGWTLVDRRVRAPRLWADRPRGGTPARGAARRRARHVRTEATAAEAAVAASVVDSALTETAVRLPFVDQARATEVPVPVGDVPPRAGGDELAVAADARTVGDLDGLLDARSPMLARAFQAARSRANGACG